MTALRRAELAGILLLVITLLAFAFWPAKPIHEDVTATPAVRQADGSLEAQRAPDAAPPPAPHIIPRGFREVRRDTVTVAPAPAAAASGCPPVRVDLSLVRNGTDQRVIASSPDGQIVSAIDVPIEAAIIPPPPKPWAAGLAYGTDRAVGIWLERDVGRLRVGLEIAKGTGPVRGEVRLGVAF